MFYSGAGILIFTNWQLHYFKKTIGKRETERQHTSIENSLKTSDYTSRFYSVSLIMLTFKQKSKSIDNIAHSCRIYRQGRYGKSTGGRYRTFERGPQNSETVLFLGNFYKIKSVPGCYLYLLPNLGTIFLFGLKNFVFSENNRYSLRGGRGLAAPRAPRRFKLPH